MSTFYNYHTGKLTGAEALQAREAEEGLRQRIIDVCHDLGADPDWLAHDSHLNAIVAELRGFADPSDEMIAEIARKIDGVDEARE